MKPLWVSSFASTPDQYPGRVVAISSTDQTVSIPGSRTPSGAFRTISGIGTGAVENPFRRFTPRALLTNITSPLHNADDHESTEVFATDDADPVVIDVKSNPPSRTVSGIPVPIASASSLDIADLKVQKFLSILNAPSLDLGLLRQMSWSGIPGEVRPTVWRLLNGYLPANMDRRSAILERRRTEYKSSVEQLYSTKKDPIHAQMLHQIQVDILRSTPTSLFSQETTKQMFERILFIFHLRHPGTGYVQGMNDLVVPFFVVFLSPYCGESVDDMDLSQLSLDVLSQVEADCYWCTALLIDKIQDYFTPDRPGLQRQIKDLDNLIERIDQPLHQHLQQHGVSLLQFAFRWMNCLLMRELPLIPIIRLWDAYLAEPNGFSTLHLYTCASLITTFSERLRNSTSDLSEVMIYLLNLPTADWTTKEVSMLLAEAYRLKVTFENAQSHLNQI